MSKPKGKHAYPFTSKHIVKFRRELKRAGDFDTLMRKKLALVSEDQTIRIAQYKDIEEYKQKFLIGAYATLRPFYTVEVPYVFWSKLYEALNSTMGKKL